MSDGDDFDAILPDDPDLAFLKIEEELLARITKVPHPERKGYYQYMNKVLCARDELKVEILSQYGLPPPINIYEKDFLSFTGEVDRFRTRVFIQASNRK